MSIPYAPSSKKAKWLNRAVTIYLAKDMQLFYAVCERDGFKALLYELDLKYKLPSRRHFVNVELPALFSEVKSTLLQILEGIKFYAGTTDLWTSIANHLYLSLTMHFIDQ